MAHTLATQTCIFCLTVVILQLRHKVAMVGIGRSKLGHKDAPILKAEYSHCIVLWCLWEVRPNDNPPCHFI